MKDKFKLQNVYPATPVTLRLRTVAFSGGDDVKKLDIPTERGTVLTGVLFDETKNPDTVVIAITGIHGNFYSNPFYYNIGDTLNAGEIDFIYAQTNRRLQRN